MMRAAGIFFLLTAAAFGFDLRRPPAAGDVDAAMAMGLPAARDELASALTAAYQPGRMGVSGSSGNAAFVSWLNLWRWCDLLTRTGEDESARLIQRHVFIDPKTRELTVYGPGYEPDKAEAIPDYRAADLAKYPRPGLFEKLLPDGAAPARGPLSGLLTPEQTAAFLKDDAFSRMFFASLSPGDYTPLVLANLAAMRAAAPDKWADYRSLAIALAIVNDSRPPVFWPHDQVAESLVPREQRPVAEQFSEWVTANETGGTLLDLRKLSPDQLKFVVDAFVKKDELAWARKNIRLPRTAFDRAFSMVSYRTDRLKGQKYSWEEDPYTLENIKSLGGICVDQAYFAMLCGKARGLPTLFFTGQGANGGHAWFGYMKSDDRWDLDCGRYATENYAVGQALDPQTWLPISDHELQLLAAQFRDRPEFAASMNDLTIAGMFSRAGNPAGEEKALESALRTCPMNPDAWAAKGAFLSRTSAPAPQRKAFHESALKQFAGNADLKVGHQMALAAIAREQGDPSTADKLERLILLQNRRKRSDLSVDVVARQMQALIDGGKLDDAGKEFRKQLGSLSDTGGGNLFYDVAAPYILALIDAGKKSDAEKAVALVRKRLNPERDGILDVELRSLEESASQSGR